MADDDDDSDKSSAASTLSTASTAKGKAAGGGGSGLGLCLCLLCVLGVCGAGAVAAFLLLDNDGGNKTDNASEASSAAASAASSAAASAEAAPAADATPDPNQPPPPEGDAPKLDAYGRFATDPSPEEDSGMDQSKAVKAAVMARQRQPRKSMRRRFKKTSFSLAAVQAQDKSDKNTQWRSQADDDSTQVLSKSAKQGARRALGAASSPPAKSASARYEKRPRTVRVFPSRRPAASRGKSSRKVSPTPGKRGQVPRRGNGASKAPARSATKATKKTASAGRAKNASVAKLNETKVGRIIPQDAMNPSLTKRTASPVAVNATRNATAANRSSRTGNVSIAPEHFVSNEPKKTGPPKRSGTAINGSVARFSQERAESADGGVINMTAGAPRSLANRTVPATVFTGTAKNSTNDSVRGSDVIVTPGSSAADASNNASSTEKAGIATNASVAKFPPKRVSDPDGDKLNVTGGVRGALTNETNPPTVFKETGNISSVNSSKLSAGGSTADASKNTSFADSATISVNRSVTELLSEKAVNVGNGKIDAAGGVRGGLTNGTVSSVAFNGAALISTNGSTLSNDAKMKPEHSASDAVKDTSLETNAFAAKLPKARGDVTDDVSGGLINGAVPPTNANGARNAINPNSLMRSVNDKIMPGSFFGDPIIGAQYADRAGIVKNSLGADLPEDTMDDAGNSMAAFEGGGYADVLQPGYAPSAMPAARHYDTAFPYRSK